MMEVGRSLTRREMLRFTATAAAVTAVGGLTKARAQAVPASLALSPRAPKRPNILMIVADDHRHDAIRAMGDTVVQTPYLDHLAACGTAFTQAHQMGGKFPAVCVPTRGSLNTGCNVFRAMTNPADNIVQPDRVTIGQHLRANGYTSHIVGKWHNDDATLTRSFGSGEAIFRRGLNTDQYSMRVHNYDPTGKYGKETVYHAKKFSSDFLADHAVDFLGKQQGEQPFFLYTAFTAPHDPRTPPKAFAKLYNPDTIPVPPNFATAHPFDNGELHVRDEDTVPHPRSAKRIQRELADYYGMVSNMDANIGRILAALEKSGQADNTIVVFTADHGIALGQHGLMGKQNLYDHSTRVPLIIKGPGVPANQKSDALIYSWDLFPTLCDLASVATPDGLDARTLSPVLTGQTQTHRTEIHALYRDVQRMAKNDRYKLIEYAVGTARHTQLFDLKNDKWEMHNLAVEPAAAGALASLRSSLGEWQLACGDTGFTRGFRGRLIF